MAKVSVIVPVYNAEKTLIDCLSNLVNQTLDDIEIITVNDCSTDGSAAILYECEKLYPEKLMVIDLEENQGAGGARNIGLMYASGEYIGFCDSDDMVDTHMYEKLYLHAKSQDFDMVDTGFFDERDNKAYLRTSDECVGALDAAKRNELIAAGGYIFTRIYKRELWDGIVFRGHTILEDMETLMLTFLKAKSIGTVKEVLYRYKNNYGSLSKNVEPHKYHKAVTDAACAIRDTVICRSDYQAVQEAVEYAITYILSSGMVNTYNSGNGLTEKERLKLRTEILDLRRDLIKIDIEKNKYSVARIDTEDRRVLGR